MEATIVEALIEHMKRLTDEQRMEIFSEFCVYCGSMDKPCYCMRDD